MTNFIFSIQIALPIFLIMCAGYVLKRTGMLNDNFIKVANTLIFRVALPIKLFSDMLDKSFNQLFDLRFIAFTVSGTLLSAGAAWLLGALVLKEKHQLGAFIQGSFRGNFVYVGLTLMENMTGSMGLKYPLVLAFVVPLYNILAVLALTFTNTNKMADFNLLKLLKQTGLNIIKNPLILSIVLGIVASELGLKLPMVLSRTAGYFGDIATPLALLTIGATFRFQTITKQILPSIYASSLKLFLTPLVAVFLAKSLGFSNPDVLLIYVTFGVPTAATSYIMTAALDGDSELASNIIMTTTLLSIVSMTLFVFAFKTIGLIGS